MGPQHAEGVNGRSARGKDIVQMAAHGKVGGDGYTKDPHGGNPDSTLDDGGWVNRGAKAASVYNELSGFKRVKLEIARRSPSLNVEKLLVNGADFPGIHQKI